MPLSSDSAGNWVAEASGVGLDPGIADKTGFGFFWFGKVKFRGPGYGDSRKATAGPEFLRACQSYAWPPEVLGRGT